MCLVDSEILHHQGDDVEMGRVMRQLRVTFGDSNDSDGLPRFYCEAPEVYLLGPIPQPLFAYDFITPQTVNLWYSSTMNNPVRM
jgi:hypothetical protein